MDLKVEPASGDLDLVCLVILNVLLSPSVTGLMSRTGCLESWSDEDGEGSDEDKLVFSSQFWALSPGP